MKQPIQDYAYFFKAAGGNPSTAVISAHGGTLGAENTFKTPINLYYLEHCGKTVKGRLSSMVANFDPRGWQEKEDAGTLISDSVLTKFQGRHSQHHGRLRSWFNTYEENYSDIERIVGDYNVAVVTIRNRVARGKTKYVTLSMLLPQLDALGVTDVLCLFCRGFVVEEYRNMFTGEVWKG